VNPYPLSARQYEVLNVFQCFKLRKLHRRPTIGDIRDRLGTKSRAGIYCGHIIPLLEKGYLERDKPAFEERGYYITERGVKAWSARRRENAKGPKPGTVKE
jgi:DNA-binding MarR family transcriptional regulator